MHLGLEVSLTGAREVSLTGAREVSEGSTGSSRPFPPGWEGGGTEGLGVADPGDLGVELPGVEAARLLPLAVQGGQEAGPFPFHGCSPLAMRL